MDSQRFDAVTRRLGAFASRRMLATSLLAGAGRFLLPGPAADDVSAACKSYQDPCASHASCCSGVGLRCVKQGNQGKKRCRCKPGWARCPGSGAGCVRVTADPENCGACGKQCPAGKPCCIEGACQPLCDGSCCADCFVTVQLNGTPDLDNPFCCEADGGTICGPKPNKLSDDRCCYPSEECVNGKCCCDGCQGSVVCGGTCCAIAACCNGECCESGEVCAMKPGGLACVAADRDCQGDQDCFSDEVCHGGTCCSGGRICSDGEGHDVCCNAGARCELPNNVCCPINTSCQSFKGHRVRR